MTSRLITPERLRGALDAAAPTGLGRVVRVVGLTFEIEGLDAGLGDIVRLGDGVGVPGEVVALGDRGPVGMPLGDMRGLRIGAPARLDRAHRGIPVGDQLLGRVIDGLGHPLDDGPPIDDLEHVDIDGAAPHPLRRELVRQPVHLGVRVLDTLVTLGRGQRIGIFAGSGVGKSTLLSMIVRNTDADVSVLALIGERGREVREFVENDLGPEGLARTVVVVATSDAPALVRTRAAFAATRIAESFRDRGLHVNLMMDSLTRFSMAQREIGLSSGEVPATRGYPPSVFALMPKLLERAGASERGSITGIYTVLVEGDDMNDPIGDTARSILDGHVTLSRELATFGHFPTVDVLESVSRVARAVTTPEQQQLAIRARELLAAYRSSRDLIEVGAYRAGSNKLTDEAIALKGSVDSFCRQDVDEPSANGTDWPALAAAVGSRPIGSGAG